MVGLSGGRTGRRRRVPAPRLHLAALVGGLIALAAGVAGWWVRGGPESIEELILVVDFTIGGTVLVTAALVGRARGAEARRAAQLEVLRAAASRMSATLSAEEIGRAVVEETRHVIDYHNARVYLLEAGAVLVPIAFEGRVGAYEQVDLAILRVQVGQGFTGWVAEHRVPLLVDDAMRDPRGMTVPGTPDVDESMLVVPMLAKDDLVGVVTLSRLGLRQFGSEDMRLLGTLADQAAIALSSTRHVQETRRLAEELRSLLEMSSALSQSLDPRAVADLMAAHLARAAGADGAQISDWDRAGDRLRTLGTDPPMRRAEMDPYYDLAGYPVTRLVLEDQRLSVVDADDPDADPAEAALLRDEGMRGLIMLPLIAKGDAIGLVELTFRGRPTDDPARITLVRTMAHEAAMALENARLYEVARDLADRDHLTGFYNHRSLHERLAEEVLRAGRARRPLSVLMIDLDDFKCANDTYGHLYGDGVLVHVAERIRSVLRGSDIPARYGGDEFAVLLPEADAEAARAVAQRILAALRDLPYAPDDRRPYEVVASIGIATHPRDGRTATELIATADVALYTSKGEGGNTARAADESGPRPIAV
jgi:diguanylate cyclase (GGDEF)-like protein